METKTGKALVVGAGIGGIRSALDLAETGYKVTLIDIRPHIGGILSILDYQFPTDRCGMCKMLPLADRDASSQFCLRKGLFHENINIMLSTQIDKVEGEPGNFQVSLKTAFNPVDPELCTGCGKCVDVCPVAVKDEFNEGLSERKAIYLPVPHAIPNPYVIDMKACTQCGACAQICPTSAINLVDEKRKDFRILIVDDELIVRDSLKEWLEVEGGFSADMADSGAKALEMLKTGSYNLMLLDIKMPGMDGVEVLEKAKEIFPNLPVVMMTAYATVETAVEAMKTGALDYLIKPFDPDILIPRLMGIYHEINEPEKICLNVGAIVLTCGASYYRPEDEKDTFGYGKCPDIVTSLEFERIISGTGPLGGKLLRLSDKKPVKKMAWIQCVGSRNLQAEADFCSGICCMYAIKEAMLAIKKAQQAGYEIETTIYYMDMRVFGKSFQRYYEKAKAAGVKFERGRVHSVVPDEKSGKPRVRFADYTGAAKKEEFDMVVLSVGQRPAQGMDELAAKTGIELNEWGFPLNPAFEPAKTTAPGIFTGGSCAGLKDISESVIFSGAASLDASLAIHKAGGSLGIKESEDEIIYDDVSRELPEIAAIICTCGNSITDFIDKKDILSRFENDPYVKKIIFMERTCTAAGWEEVCENVKKTRPNRLLIAACLPYVYARKLKALGKETGLDPALMDVVDIKTPLFNVFAKEEKEKAGNEIISAIEMGISGLKHARQTPLPTMPVFRKALVIGGGISGMTAALSIAGHGYETHIVEKSENTGGNLLWLKKTIEGHETAPLLSEIKEKTESHPLVNIHTGSRVIASFGQAGAFHTTIGDKEGNVEVINHGAVIFATGGTQAKTESYGYGSSPGIITQKEMEEKLAGDDTDFGALECVVMIQCVDCRQEPRNYCSRVCCPTSLKHALALKEKNPDMSVFVFYRDMMATGFTESYFTKARKAEIIFIPYTPDKKPSVETGDNKIIIKAYEPIIGRQIEIEADILELATGIVPDLPQELAEAFGINIDPDGFFEEAESKWRPVDALKEGVFACGIALSPRPITESIATAGAAAQRALRILSKEKLKSGSVVAQVRESLCSLCGLCIDACPYGARILDTDVGKILINPVMCQGCGACAAICPNDASYILGYPPQKMMEIISAAL